MFFTALSSTGAPTKRYALSKYGVLCNLKWGIVQDTVEYSANHSYHNRNPSAYDAEVVTLHISMPTAVLAFTIVR